MMETYAEFQARLREEEQRVEVSRRLLETCLNLLEYATFHDGRYDQSTRWDWQRDAYEAVTELAEALKRIKYASCKEEEALEKEWRQIQRYPEGW